MTVVRCTLRISSFATALDFTRFRVNTAVLYFDFSAPLSAIWVVCTLVAAPAPPDNVSL